MRKTIALLTIIALAAAGGASAQSIDKNGKCHDANGAFAKMEVCKPAKPTGPTSGKCRDKTTKKFAKCDAPNTEKVPAPK